MEDKDALWAKILIWIANTLGLLYNIPQLYHTYITKKVDDISSLSLILRFISSLLWSFYCIYFNMLDIGISWYITFISSVLIIYYKVKQQIMNEFNMSNMSNMSNV